MTLWAEDECGKGELGLAGDAGVCGEDYGAVVGEDLAGEIVRAPPRGGIN